MIPPTVADWALLVAPLASIVATLTWHFRHRPSATISTGEEGE